jgi:hypothetical protein
MFRLQASILTALVALIAALTPTTAKANDMAFAGAGASLVPFAELRVRMMSENISLTRAAPEGYRVLGPGHWHIEARYRLRNVTDETFAVRIGSPEPACPPERDCTFDGYADLTTTVRGTPVALTIGSVDSDHPMAEDIARVHLFTVRFAPGETVAVTHSYRHGLSEYTNGGEDLTYLTRTAGYWAGTIGEARIRVTLPFRPWGLSLGNWSDALELFEERLVDGAPRIEFVLNRTDWKPETDLRLFIGPGGPSVSTSSLIEGCPAPGQLFTDVMVADAFDAAAAAVRLGPLDEKTLRGCRNSVYAHHGYRFADTAVNHAFYGETGVRVIPPEAGTGRPGVVFVRNPDFSPSMLTLGEHAYVAAIQALERLRRR